MCVLYMYIDIHMMRIYIYMYSDTSTWMKVLFHVGVGLSSHQPQPSTTRSTRSLSPKIICISCYIFGFHGVPIWDTYPGSLSGFHRKMPENDLGVSTCFNLPL